MPALDGLRALAVAAVMAYHLGFGWAGGGYLGVDLFFVLSGFLITGLLVSERSATGSIRLPSFWSRRARRLLPALFGVLAAVTLYAGLGGPGLNRQLLRGDGLAALAYVANWHFIAAHQSYFAQFSAPSPLEHTWSLAIEEQFYVVWPLLLLLVAKVAGRRWRAATMALTATLAAASVVAMAVLAGNGGDPSRAYFGTDSRAFELLIGAGLALLLARRPAWSPRRPRVLHGAGAASLVALLAGWSVLSGTPVWMFRGGFLAASVLGAVVIAGVSRPAPGPLGALLSRRPIRWVGAISYGLYLWHWPVFRALSPANLAVPAWVAHLAAVAATFGLAAASYYLIELPIRRGALAGWRRRLALPAAVGATAVGIVAVSMPVATAAAVAPPSMLAASVASASPAGSSAPAGAPSPAGPANVAQIGTVRSTAPTSSAAPPAAPTPALFSIGRVPTAADPLRVLVIGDSVMNTTEPGLAAALQATGAARVTNLAFPGWGLTITSSWRTDWPGIIARDHPEVVIGSWSWDNPAAATDPAGYTRLLGQALDVLLAPGDGVKGVVFLQFPKVGQRLAETPAHMALVEAQRDAWDSVVAGAAASRPQQVAYLPVAGALELKGAFSPWLQGADGSWSRARMIDNTHLCPSGAARLGSAVLASVSPAWSLPAPVAGWWKGSWTADPRFNDPPGSCAADQPPASVLHAAA
ncbi:MAG TPA: acyltransferase family protein [Acidimicrobiales bacterium]|nr:acyltransferase family protein [Acidimicrobiales bacterium]